MQGQCSWYLLPLGPSTTEGKLALIDRFGPFPHTQCRNVFSSGRLGLRTLSHTSDSVPCVLRNVIAQSMCSGRDFGTSAAAHRPIPNVGHRLRGRSAMRLPPSSPLLLGCRAIVATEHFIAPLPPRLWREEHSGRGFGMTMWLSSWFAPPCSSFLARFLPSWPRLGATSHVGCLI